MDLTVKEMDAALKQTYAPPSEEFKREMEAINIRYCLGELPDWVYYWNTELKEALQEYAVEHGQKLRERLAELE
jgi:hypothetical protein